MAFSGGTFSRTFDCTTDRDNGVKILASKFDTELDGFATGLSTCILKDGTQTCTAAIPFAEGLTVPDNKTIVLGTNSDITIQYDESTNDSLEIAANVEGAALGIVLKADQGDDNADQHKLNIADGGVLTLGSKISGSFVNYLTHTPNSTVASSTTAVAGNLTVGGDLTLGSGAVISEAELEAIDGVTAGTVAASKAVIVDSNKDIASFRNVTLTGELDAGSLDISGDADIDGTLEADAMTLNGTAITATATLDTGISNNNVPKFTSGVADDDFLRVAGTAIEGRSASEVLSDIGAAPAAGSSNIVTTGALNSGSITSGFGSIDNGSSAITTTGTITGGVMDVDNIRIDGNTISSTDTNGNVTVDPNGSGQINLSANVDVTGGFTATDGCTITTADNTAQLTLKSTDTDASAGPILNLSRDNSSAADNDLVGQVQFNADDDGNNQTTYGRIHTVIEDASNGNEDGLMQIHTNVAGTLRDRIKITSSEVVLNEESIDSDFRVESDNNANALFVQGSSGNVGIGTAPNRALHVKSSNATVMQVESTNASIAQMTFVSDGAASNPAIGAIDDTAFNIQTGNVERLRIEGGGDIRVATAGRIVNEGGIFLGGTASANHLDHYEEGSFGLTEVQGSITGDTVRSGTYTKIGRMVMIDFDITGTAITISSYVGFSGLPFTPASTGTGFTSTEDIDLANGVEMAVGTNGRLYLSGGGGSNVSRMSGSLVYRTA